MTEQSKSDRLRAAVALALAEGLGYGARLSRALRQLGPDLPDGDVATAVVFDGLSEQRRGTATVESALERLRAYEARGVQVIPLGSRPYPWRLAECRGAPALLFTRGDHQRLAALRCAAVVGTRRASDAGMRSAHATAAELVRLGYAVVSGLALGIDTAAHEGALGESGTTIAVLAGSVEHVYPRANAALAERIVSDGGVLVSEYPPDAPTSRGGFVARNRIQAGLSECVIAIEAGEGSGTMHTVRFARDYGRPVLCPSAARLGLHGAGLTELVQEEGCVLYESGGLADAVTESLAQGGHVGEPGTLF